MKFLDKIKDLFMEEEEEFEDVELEEEDKKDYAEPKKPVLPKVMRDTITREEKNMDMKIKTQDLVKEEKKEEIPQRKFNFPIDIEDDLPSREEVNKNFEQPKTPSIKVDEVIESMPRRNVNVLTLEKEVPKKVSELYQKKEEERIKPKFKASPVISPVYGVLDKNYTKEEVKERTDDSTTMKRPSKKVDFETVRKKAFGNLADDIKDNLLCENCELYKEVKKISSLKEDDLLYDMTVEDEKDVTIEKAYDNYEEFGVAYEPKLERRRHTSYEEDTTVEPVSDEKVNESFSKIVSMIDEKLDADNDIVEEPIIEDKSEDDVVEVKPTTTSVVDEEVEVPSRKEKKKEEKVDEDFFELIDSMYKERVDD